jgi:hypothetical protein
MTNRLKLISKRPKTIFYNQYKQYLINMENSENPLNSLNKLNTLTLKYKVLHNKKYK